jgi:alkaline phosphatase
MRLLSISLLLSTLLLSFPGHAQNPADASPDDAPLPRHVILIIGDGMDEQQITIARNYLQGATGRLLLDEMPLRGASQILTIEDKEDGKPVYVADSANTATSMATGQVTSRGRIATSAGSDKPIETIVELAEAAGYRTGIVSTASVTDATPASFAAHINFRLCEDPTLVDEVIYESGPRELYLGSCAQHAKARGGLGSISEQLADSGLHVILGGGQEHFEPLTESGKESVLNLARKNGFQVVTTPAQLANRDPRSRLLGLFSESTMPVRLQGEDGRTAEEPEPSLLNHVHRYLGDVTLPAVMDCEPNPEAAAVPSLQLMTDAALEQLSRDNDTGFFLMIESASIDKQSHERKPCGSIGEVEQLDEALASALAFADENPQTLIIVTADHSQAAQLIPYVSLFEGYPIPTYTPGMLARIRTPEGSHMAVNYATTNFFMEEHTGAAVPVYSNSEGIGRVAPYIQQLEIFEITRDYLGL